MALGFQLLGAAGARVSSAFGEKLLDFLFVERPSLGLIIRPFVIVEPEPLHRL